MGYGWLSKRDLPPEVNGIPLDPDLPTRREEYTLVYETARELEPGIVSDLGCGYDHSKHIAAEVLASLGWEVVAVDDNARVKEMPPIPRVHRVHADMRQRFRVDPPENYDMSICISVLEHLSAEDRRRVAEGMTNIVKPGGTIIVTADEMQPQDLTDLFPAFDFGSRVHCSAHLSPLVAFGVGKKQPRQPEVPVCHGCGNPAVTVCTYVISLKVDFIALTSEVNRCGNVLCARCRCHT